MKNFFLIIIILIFSSFCFQALAQNSSTETTLQNAFIKHDRVNWQIYEFSAVTNLENTENLVYDWSIDSKDSFNVDKFKYFFPKGEHLVKLKVEDEYGNTKYDTVRLNVSFWSLKNNWLWWMIYAVSILIIIYYWIVKMFYLFNKNKISKQARYFLDILDEHGWVERAVEQHLKKLGMRNEK